MATVLDRRTESTNALQLLAAYRGDKVVHALISVLDDTTRVRVKAIHALGMLKAIAALESLIAALTEPGTRITAAATDALRTITGQDFREDAKAWRAWWKQQAQ